MAGARPRRLWPYCTLSTLPSHCLVLQRVLSPWAGLPQLCTDGGLEEANRASQLTGVRFPCCELASLFVTDNYDCLSSVHISDSLTCLCQGQEEAISRNTFCDQAYAAGTVWSQFCRFSQVVENRRSSGQQRMSRPQCGAIALTWVK